MDLEGGVTVDEQLVFGVERLLEWRGGGAGRFVPLGEGRYLALTNELRTRLAELATVAEAQKDGASLSADLNLMGNILLEAGQPDAALAKFAQQIEVIGKADVPVEVKEAARRNALFSEARVALAKNDLATAKARATAYGTQVAVKKVPFEVRQHHELLGQIALQEKNPATAAAELEQANQQDPRVLYLLAMALQAKGDGPKARVIGAKAAEFNGLAVNYAYVRTKARELLARS